jgi:hypothetical protein
MNAVAAQVNFLDPAVLADPFADYRDALAHGPVREVAPGRFVAFSHDLCSAVRGDTAVSARAV